MSKVIRLSDETLKNLEKYKNYLIEAVDDPVLGDEISKNDDLNIRSALHTACLHCEKLLKKR